MSMRSQDLPIVSPCPITLDKSELSQGDRSMHCAHCVKEVHLLSNMTELEARRLLREKAGNKQSLKKEKAEKFEHLILLCFGNNFP